LEHLGAEGGTVLLLGGSDVGKTTFCRALVKQGNDAGLKTALVDADLGQSLVGLPGTVTLAILAPAATHDPGRPAADPLATTARTLFFVGAVSPRECLITHLVATVRACQAAWEAGAKLTVVDTTGYVSAPEGAMLKRAKIDTIRPDVIVGLAHKNELQSILGAYVGSTFPRVAMLPPSPAASARKKEVRRRTRAERFRRYFGDAQRCHLSLAQRVLLADFPLNWQKHRPALAELCSKGLGYPVPFVTLCGGTPLVVTEADCTPTEVEFLTATLRGKPRTYASEQFSNCLVGIVDDEDEPISVGLLLSVDWQGGSVELLVPPDIDLDRARLLKLGRIRIDPDGSELSPAPW
jgi:polynucleotide 5'-hydroxyl-kinase GRC3/NOL9